MANLIGNWRAALVADLQLQFPDARVASGQRSGVNRDQDLIAVFWPGTAEVEGRVVVGQARLLVRYWPKRPKIRDDQTPSDPAALEEAGWDLAAFLQTKQTAYTAHGVWFCRLVSCTPDYDPDEWAVEAVLIAQFDNPAVVA